MVFALTASSGITTTLSMLEEFVESVADMIHTWVGTITTGGNEILLLGAVIVPLVGIGIGALKRMLSARV